jgi:hypothetical protein
MSARIRQRSGILTITFTSAVVSGQRWTVVGAADFDRDGHPDFALFNSSTRQTAIWYLSGRTFLRSAFGPTVPGGWALVATADFNSDGHPDYLLYNPTSRQTAIWYLNNNVYVSAA